MGRWAGGVLKEALDEGLENGPEKALDKGAMLAKKPGSPIFGNKIREIRRSWIEIELWIGICCLFFSIECKF